MTTTKKTYERKGFSHLYCNEDGETLYSHFGILGDPEDGRGNKSQAEDVHSPLCACGWWKGFKRVALRVNNAKSYWGRKQKRSQ